MIRCSNVHMTMVVGQHDVAPAIERFSMKHYLPSAFFCLPHYAARGIVELVLRLGDATKVCHSVIRAVAVDVIDVLGLFAVEKKPCKPVNKVGAPLVRDANVTIAQFKTAGAESAACDGLDSAEYSAFRVIREVFANGIRDNFRIHAESPLSVARGSVAPTTDTPILSQNLRHPGAGMENRKDNLHLLSTDNPFKERS